MYFTTIREIQVAQRAAGHMWHFTGYTERQPKVVGGPKAVFGGHYFVTTEKRGETRRYTVRAAWSTGIQTIGRHEQYATATEALAAARQYGREPKLTLTAAGPPVGPPPRRQR